MTVDPTPVASLVSQVSPPENRLEAGAAVVNEANQANAQAAQQVVTATAESAPSNNSNPENVGNNVDVEA